MIIKEVVRKPPTPEQARINALNDQAQRLRDQAKLVNAQQKMRKAQASLRQARQPQMPS